MSDSRTLRFKGHSPPWLDDESEDSEGEETFEWEISTVARRTTNDDSTATCAVTDQTVQLNEPHYFITSTRETAGKFTTSEHDQAIVAFEGGLEELARQLEIEDDE